MKEKLLKVFKFIEEKKIPTALIFTVEFMLSIAAVYLWYVLRINKFYQFGWNLNYFIRFAVVGVLLMAVIILNLIQSRDKIEKIFLSFLIPIGMMYLVFMIPTFVPDEAAHMWKSYEISEGIIIAPIDENGNSTTKVPRFLAENTWIDIGKYSILNEVIKEETDYNDKVEVVCGVQTTSPLLYTFSSIGLLLGRMLSLNGIIAQYLARMLNYIVFLIFAYYSVKLIPFGKLFLSAYLFMPMVLQQAMSISADSVTNSICIFYIAYVMYILFKEEKVTKKEQIVFAIFSILVGVAKTVYAPLVGLTLLLISSKNMEKRNKTILIVVTIILSVIATVGWYIHTTKYTTNPEAHLEFYEAANVNPEEQVKFLIEHPLKAPLVVYESIAIDGDSYIFTMIGSLLGWLDISISNLLILEIALIIILSIFFENHKYSLSKKQRLWLLTLYFGSLSLILLALYIAWTSVGAQTVLGIQGRYFIPITILPLLCLCMKNNYVKFKNIEIYIPIALTIINLYVIDAISVYFVW